MEHEIWPPPPTQEPAVALADTKPPFSLVPLLCAVGYGLLLGFIDVHLASGDDPDDLVGTLYLAGALVLGFWQPKTFWLSAILLAFCFYSSHVVAILSGVVQIYVDREAPSASTCLTDILHNTYYAVIGAAARLLWNRVTRKKRQQ